MQIKQVSLMEGILKEYQVKGTLNQFELSRILIIGINLCYLERKFPYLVIPRLVAMINMGAISLSSARLRKEKHSISNMCTSSMNNTYKISKHNNIEIHPQTKCCRCNCGLRRGRIRKNSIG